MKKARPLPASQQHPKRSNTEKTGGNVKIAVFVKRVPDTESIIKIKSDSKSIDESSLSFVMNPYDEYAIEEALRIKETTGEGEVVVVSLGSEEARESIRSALAMGADRAIHALVPELPDDPLVTATALKEAIVGEDFDLLLFGKQAVDSDNAQIGTLVAELLDLPSASVVVKVSIEGSSVTVHREIDGGEEVISLPLPAVLTAQKGLNEPRYASLKGIMAAKKKVIDEKEIPLREASLEVVSVEYPPERAEGKIVGEGIEALDDLLRLLREEAKVL
jgi:electron transfer flavoprotein beta subunit